MTYKYTLGTETWTFSNLAELMARATPARSGDRLAGVIARSAEERAVAQMALAAQAVSDRSSGAVRRR